MLTLTEPKLVSGFGQYVVLDGLPIVQGERIAKLKTVVAKVGFPGTVIKCREAIVVCFASLENYEKVDRNEDYAGS